METGPGIVAPLANVPVDCIDIKKYVVRLAMKAADRVDRHTANLPCVRTYVSLLLNLPRTKWGTRSLRHVCAANSFPPRYAPLLSISSSPMPLAAALRCAAFPSGKATKPTGWAGSTLQEPDSRIHSRSSAKAMIGGRRHPSGHTDDSVVSYPEPPMRAPRWQAQVLASR